MYINLQLYFNSNDIEELSSHLNRLYNFIKECDDLFPYDLNICDGTTKKELRITT